MLPKYVIVVPVYFEELPVGLRVVFRRKDPLKVAGPTHLLFGLKQHQPIFRAEQLKTVIVVKLIETVDVF